jgi:broad specificity phosphatase PhoE
MKTITFIRHGLSESNMGRNVDTKNTKLALEGMENVKNLSGEYELIILSPLRRAIQTYALSNIKTQNVIISPLVREWTSHGVHLPNFLDLEDIFKESIEDLDKRIENTMSFIKAQKETNICVISHSEFINRLIFKLFNKPDCFFTKYWICKF